MNKKSVVFLRSNPIKPDPRVEKEARSLSKGGFEVIVVGWDRENKFERYEEKDWVKVYRIKLKASFGKGLKNLKYLIKWQMSLLMWLLKYRGLYSCIHACDFDTIIPALFCKLLYKKRVVYDIFDFYADMLRNVPNFLKKIIRKIDLILINFADAVVIADESRKKQIEGSSPRELVVIYNSPSNEFFTFRRPVKNVDSLVVAYIGLLQKERGLIEMINVVRKHPSWRFILGGFGGDEDFIKEYIKDISNVEFVGRVPYEKTLELYNTSDVLFATYDPKIPNHRFSSANKLFEAMMLGKPIIVARSTGMDLLVEKYNLGFVINYGNEDEIEETLKIIESWDKDKKTEFAKHSQEVFNTYFSWDIMEKRLLELYNRLCEAKC